MRKIQREYLEVSMSIFRRNLKEINPEEIPKKILKKSEAFLEILHGEIFPIITKSIPGKCLRESKGVLEKPSEGMLVGIFEDIKGKITNTIEKSLKIFF